ncbi:MAG: hypothetical protein PHY79_10185 [Anaerolineae bacterium]|nr:hypothetical protein [Anaerolineae bacterium]
MRRFLLFLALLLIAVPLAFAFRDLGRLVTAEVIRLIWTVRILVEGLPQLGLWVALLALVLVTALANLAGPRPAPRDEGGPVDAPGQVWELYRWIRRASLGEYSRWTLHRYLEGLAWEVMAARHGSGTVEQRRRFRAGELALDPDIAAFLEAAGEKSFRPTSGLRAWLRRLLRGKAERRPAVPPLERIVEFMEEQLARSAAPHNSLQPEAEHERDAG